MKNKKIFVMTSSGPVSLDNIPQEDREVLAEILGDLFPDSKKLEEEKYGGVMSIGYYIHKIAVRNGVRYPDIDILLHNLWKVSPGAVIQILARAIAMEMDLNYEDHISTVDVKYFIDHIYYDYKIASSDLTGENYRDIGFFRNKDDAYTALEILKPLIKGAYGGKQEDKRCN